MRSRNPNRRHRLLFGLSASLECARPSAFPVGGIMNERMLIGCQRRWSGLRGTFSSRGGEASAMPKNGSAWIATPRSLHCRYEALEATSKSTTESRRPRCPQPCVTIAWDLLYGSTSAPNYRNLAQPVTRLRQCKDDPFLVSCFCFEARNFMELTASIAGSTLGVQLSTARRHRSQNMSIVKTITILYILNNEHYISIVYNARNSIDEQSIPV